MARNLWIACSFFFVVAQFAFLRGLDVRQLLLFVVPVVVAVAFAQQDPATRGSRIAQVFILLISIGMLVAEIPWLFPNLGGVEPKLPRGIDRALAWYVTVYLLFFTCICPIHLFTASLASHRKGHPADFSVPTCWLGLFTATVLGVGTVSFAFRFVGVWPVM